MIAIVVFPEHDVRTEALSFYAIALVLWDYSITAYAAVQILPLDQDRERGSLYSCESIYKALA
jgi:hypothetical protein